MSNSRKKGPNNEIVENCKDDIIRICDNDLIIFNKILSYKPPYSPMTPEMINTIYNYQSSKFIFLSATSLDDRKEEYGELLKLLKGH